MMRILCTLYIYMTSGSGIVGRLTYDLPMAMANEYYMNTSTIFLLYTTIYYIYAGN